MKVLITKSDGTPTKSKVHALQFLEKKGISKDCLIEENGQFFYEEDGEEVGAVQVPKAEAYKEPSKVEIKHTKGLLEEIVQKEISWDTPVFDKNNERTRLIIPNTNVEATITAKHPAGQLRNKSSFEIAISDENFIMSVDLISKIFKVKEVK